MQQVELELVMHCLGKAPRLLQLELDRVGQQVSPLQDSRGHYPTALASIQRGVFACSISVPAILCLKNDHG